MLVRKHAPLSSLRSPSADAGPKGDQAVGEQKTRLQKLKTIAFEAIVLMLMLVVASTLAAVPTMYHLVWAR